jgi:hypothetical protein
MTRDNLPALVNSIVRQGILGRRQWRYWKFLPRRRRGYRRCFGAAVTLAVMGYHFQAMTGKLSKAIDAAAVPAESAGLLLREKRRPVL